MTQIPRLRVGLVFRERFSWGLAFTSRDNSFLKGPSQCIRQHPTVFFRPEIDPFAARLPPGVWPH